MDEQKKKNIIQSTENPSGMIHHHSHAVLQDIGNRPDFAPQAQQPPLPPPQVDETNDNPSSYIENSFDSIHQVSFENRILWKGEEYTLPPLQKVPSIEQPPTAKRARTVSCFEEKSAIDTELSEEPSAEHSIDIDIIVDEMPCDIILGAQILPITYSRRNTKKVELDDFFHNNKFSIDHLTFIAILGNEKESHLIRSNRYKVMILAEQNEERCKDTSMIWTGPIYPDKNNTDHNIVLDNNAKFSQSAKTMIYTFDELNTNSCDGLENIQVFIIRTDIIDSCIKEDYNSINKLCDKSGYGLFRVHSCNSNMMYIDRQVITLIKKDKTDWFWLTSAWMHGGKRYSICLPTIVSASIYGKCPAFPIKDPIIATYSINGKEFVCQVEVSVNGILRSGKQMICKETSSVSSECSEIDCSNLVIANGKCHFDKCDEVDCNNVAQGKHGKCNSHRYGKCDEVDCNNGAQGKHGKCNSHRYGKCDEVDCNNVAKGNHGNCRSHRYGECNEVDCNNYAIGKHGKCENHRSGECNVVDCHNVAQGKHGKCFSHRFGECNEVDCNNFARGTYGKCKTHRYGKCTHRVRYGKCYEVYCNRYAVGKHGKCVVHHFDEYKEV